MTRWTSLLLACALALPLAACGRQASYRAQGSADADASTPDANADPREDTATPDEDTPPTPDTDAPDTDGPDTDAPDTDAPDTDAPNPPTPSPEACALETLPLQEWSPDTQALWSRHLRGGVYPQAAVVHVSDEGAATLTATDPRALRLGDDAWQAGQRGGGMGVLLVLFPDGATERAPRRSRAPTAAQPSAPAWSAPPSRRTGAPWSPSRGAATSSAQTGRLYPNPALDRWSNLLLALEPDGSLRAAREVSLDSNTLCQTALPRPRTAAGSCPATAARARAWPCASTADLNPRWELRTQAQVPNPGNTYAYLFQNTAPSAGLSFLDVWRNTDALVGQTLAPLDSADDRRDLDRRRPRRLGPGRVGPAPAPRARGSR
jgi:hypothetical protein